MTGFEPVTSSLPRKCSTTELHRQFQKKSGKRDSNPRPSAWKADALSTELFPQKNPWAKMDSNHRSRKTADLQSAPFGHSGIRPRTCLPETPHPSCRRVSVRTLSAAPRRPVRRLSGRQHRFFYCETGANLDIKSELKKYFGVFLFTPCFFLVLLQLFDKRIYRIINGFLKRIGHFLRVDVIGARNQ